MDGRTDGIDEKTGGWTDQLNGLTDRWVDGRKYRETDGRIERQTTLDNHILVNFVPLSSKWIITELAKMTISKHDLNFILRCHDTQYSDT
jgi:hypothetical protein